MLFSTLEAEETAKKNTKITNLKNNPYFVQKIDDKYKTTKNNMFWLSVEINSVEFRKGCLSTALCHRPMFKLSQTMTLNSQTVMMSWPMEGGAETLLQKDILHPFISHWEFGDPEDISIGCQIAGTDPSFGFARVCDEATARRIFQEENVRQTVMKGVRNEESILQVPDPLESQNSKTIYVQMNGRCFNTTLSIQKHTERCPWCVDPNVDIKVVGENNEENNGQQNHLKGTNPDETGKTIQLQNILILVLSGVVVFSLSGLCYALTIHWRYKKRRPPIINSSLIRSSKKRINNTQQEEYLFNKNNSKRILKLISPPRAQRSLPCSPEKQREKYEQQQQQCCVGGINSSSALYPHEGEQSAYDVPWDNKFCLVPRQWLLNGQTINSNEQRPPSLFFSGGSEPIPSLEQQQIIHPYATCYEFNRTASIKTPSMTISHQSTLPPPPPLNPPPPSYPQIHSQTLNRRQSSLIIPSQQHQQQSFISPNTSTTANCSSSFGRHDDSGLDSV